MDGVPLVVYGVKYKLVTAVQHGTELRASGALTRVQM
jgi:hypothetical protein